jgi:hypothetical protein
MLRSTINELKDKKRKTEEKFFRDILEQIQRTIFFSMEKDEKACFFNVPLYRLGHPMFNINHIVKHIQEEFSIHEISVNHIGGTHIFLDWSKCTDPSGMNRKMVARVNDNVSALNAMVDQYKHYL